MEGLTIKNSIFLYIENLVSSLEIGLINIFNKLFDCYNRGVERATELTLIGIKGHIISHQSRYEIISNIIVEDGILKESFSEPKASHEIQWKISSNKEIRYKGIINQLEDNFEVIKKK